MPAASPLVSFSVLNSQPKENRSKKPGYVQSQLDFIRYATWYFKRKFLCIYSTAGPCTFVTYKYQQNKMMKICELDYYFNLEYNNMKKQNKQNPW